MRKHFLTTVAAMAIATPALAADLSGGYAPPPGDPLYSSAPMVVGDLEMSLGWTRVDFEGEESWNNFQGWGRANVPVGDTWNVLVEAGGGAAFGGDISDGFGVANFSANGHVWANRNDLRYGVFGGASYGVFDALTFGTVGLEAEVDMGNAVLGGQGFYSWTDFCGSCESYGVSGWVDYYFTPNTKGTATLAWSRTDVGSDLDIFGGSARLTHRLTGTPLNVFGEASYYNIDLGPNGDAVNLLGGLTVMLDGPGYTQQEFDRNVPFTFRHPLNADLGEL